MATARPSIVPMTKPSRKKSRKVALLTPLQFERMTVRQQIEHVFCLPAAASRVVSIVLGILFGGIFPLAAFLLVHDPRGVASNMYLWWLVGAALTYSAPKVFMYAQTFLGTDTKGIIMSLATAGLLEGTMSFAPIPCLKYLSLAILVFVNVTSAAIHFQIRKQPVAKKSKRG